MNQYIALRLLQSALVVFVVSLLTFFAVYASGDPAALLAPIDASMADVEALRVRMGLDRPLHVQYVSFLKELFAGEVLSFRHKLPPVELILPHFVRSVQLGIPALALSIVIGIPLGSISASRRGGPIDVTILAGALVGQAIPLFLLSTLLMWVFAVNLKLLPVSGRGTILHYILPVVSITAYNLAIIVRLTRSSFLETIGEDYVRTARSKGLREQVVMVRHILPNAALPIVSLIGLRIGTLLSGILVVESIFAWPGMGKLLYDAVLQRDIPLVVVGSLAVAAFVSILNLIVDLSYMLLDPRIKY